jgi:RNA polymerase sigma-70 factor (ECF subfamily)
MGDTIGWTEESRRVESDPVRTSVASHQTRVRHKTDDQLIASARKGDKRAFAALVKRYEETVYRFSYKVCRDREKAEEALQDTFINMYRKLGTFDGKSKFSTWLYSIVTNNCLMKHRKRKIDELLESFDDPPVNDDGTFVESVARWDETPVDVLMKKEFQTLMDRAVLKLPVEYRLVFVLRDLEDKSTAETARILGISEEAAKSRLRRARAFLRGELSPYMHVGAREVR